MLEVSLAQSAIIVILGLLILIAIEVFVLYYLVSEVLNVKLNRWAAFRQALYIILWWNALRISVITTIDIITVIITHFNK